MSIFEHIKGNPETIKDLIAGGMDADMAERFAAGVRLFPRLHVYSDGRGLLPTAAKALPARRVCPPLAILIIGPIDNPAAGLVTLRGHRTHEIAL